MKAVPIFLLSAAIGLVPIALSYGVDPGASLDRLFGVTIEGTNGTHLFRAIMGLYLALAAFWVVGALRQRLAIPALWSLVVFMLGLAAGRLLSLVVDGLPHPLLMVYLGLEALFGIGGILLLKRLPSAG